MNGPIHLRRLVSAPFSFLFFALLALSLAEAAPPGHDLFTNGPPLDLSIEISPENLQRLSKDSRKDVPAIVREGTNVYDDVVLHLKGAAGSFRQINEKPALTISFGKKTGERFHGLRKIHLNNSVQDRSYLHELLARDLFVAADVPATRVAHALLVLNGQRQGLYVLKEGFTRDFLKVHFRNTRGNLYDMEPGREITERLERDLGEGPNDYSDLKVLAAACQEKDPKLRWERLQGILDVERFVSFMAMEIITCHWDGYCLGRNNFRVYHDLDRDRIMFFPHGTDQLFANATAPMRVPMNGLVAQTIMRTPEARRLYYARFRELATNVFQLPLLTNRVWSVVNALSPALEAHNPRQARQFRTEAAQVCEQLAQRIRGLNRLIHEPEPQPLAFSQGIARLSGWRTQLHNGHAQHKEITEEGRKLLLIDSEGQPCTASWRKQVVLPGGKYRFQAQARCEQVVPSKDREDIGRGVGIRISRDHRTEELSGDKDWTILSFDIDVPEGGSELELICELRALQGKVWFDASSLQLVKISPGPAKNQ